MPEHVSFPSIEQYRNVVKLVRERAQHEADHLNGITILAYATKAQQKKAMKAIAKALQMKVAKKR